MASYKTTLGELNLMPDPNWTGDMVPDFYRLAVASSTDVNDTDYDNFIIVEGSITDMSVANDPEINETQYIYEGKKKVKTSVGQEFTISGDRHVGYFHQELMLSFQNIYSLGSEDSSYNFCWLNIKTGKGTCGRATCTVNSESGGSAGGNTPMEYVLYCATPEEFLYSGVGDSGTVDPPAADPEDDPDGTAVAMTWSNSVGVWNEQTQNWEDATVKE